MVAEGPLPDFLERKELMAVIHEKLTKGRLCKEVGFESYALPSDPMSEAYNNRSTWYATRISVRRKSIYVAVGSSSK